MKTYKPHPAAALFPMMGETELRELAADIAARGQLQPIIITSKGLVLDGRNRLAACRLAGVEPDVLMWDREDDDASPTEWVLSQNLHRRHLTADQRAHVALEAEALLAVEAKKRQRAAGGAKIKGERLAPTGAKRSGDGKAAAQAARLVGVGARTVERAKRVKNEKPELYEQVKAGALTFKQAEKAIVREKQVEQARVHVTPAGEYPVVVIDPPWSYQDELDGSDAARGGCPYPSMSIEQIAALELPLAQDAAVFLWVTNSHLIDPMAYAIVAATWQGKYGLEAKGIATWEKDRIGLGRYFRNKTEHLVLLVRGKPVFTEEKPWSHFRAPVGEHSEKPEAAYWAIEKFCASPSRLEMFARAPRKGWVTSGSELEGAFLLGAEPPSGLSKKCVATDEFGLRCTCDEHPGSPHVFPPKPAKRKRKLNIIDVPDSGAAA